MGKGILILLFALVLLCIIFALRRHRNLPICHYKQKFKLLIEEYVEKGNDIYGTAFVKIDIKEVETIENKVEALLTINDALGEAQLTRKFNGSYKVDYLSKGNIFLYSIKEINNKKYLVVKGKNYDMAINKIMVQIDNKRYELNIPNKEYFIVYCSVPRETISEFPSDFQLLNEKNINITLEIYNKYNH